MFEKLSIQYGLTDKLFNDLGIKGRMWLAIKDLYTDVKAQVLYSGELSREFDVSQGTGQGRIFAPFMYKVYINSLLQKLFNHCYAISISLPAPSFADDVILLALFSSFLKTFLNICHQYSVTSRYEFNHTKSGIVTFGETKPRHSRLALFKPGFFWLSMTGGGVDSTPPPENNVTVKLGQ